MVYPCISQRPPDGLAKASVDGEWRLDCAPWCWGMFRATLLLCCPKNDPKNWVLEFCHYLQNQILQCPNTRHNPIVIILQLWIRKHHLPDMISKIYSFPVYHIHITREFLQAMASPGTPWMDFGPWRSSLKGSDSRRKKSMVFSK